MWSICIVIFLNQSLRNQNKKCIITDLKPEYKVAIDKLRVKQQFCTFHLKQLINREIRDYIKENNASKRRNRNNTQLYGSLSPNSKQ